MRFSSAVLVVLASISQVLGMVAFGTPHYSHGVLTFTTTTWTDAPSVFNFALVSADGTVTTIESNVPATPGSYSLTLPSIPAGTYRLQAQSADGSQVYTTTSGFTVAAGDIASTVTAASYTVTSTGTVRPLLTTSAIVVSGSTSVGTFTLTAAGAPATPSAITAGSSSSTSSSGSSVSVVSVTTTITTGTTTSVPPTTTASAFTSSTVLTSGTLTTTLVTTGTITTAVTPSSSSGAATATAVTTTKSAGSKAAGMSFGLPVVAAFVVGALLL